VDEKRMRYLVENYYDHLTELTEKLNHLTYETKITATYGLNAGGGGGFSCSKVENKALDHYCLMNGIYILEWYINTVDKAIKVLDNKERQVIEKMKIHKNKLKTIAIELKKKKKYVYDTRKRALKKMCDYIEEVENENKM
jgi:hypothetical protein